MIVNTKAIVIKKNKVSGADVILTLYSKELGKKRVYIKGARHINSRYLGASQLLVESDFSLYIKPSLSSINSVSIIDTHNDIRDDLSKFFIASYVLELIDKFTEEDTTDLNLYEFLSFALKCLEAENESKLKFFRIVFTIKLLQITGLSPEVNFCTSCLSHDKLQYFSAAAGGTVCENCKKNYRDIKKLKIENLNLIKLSLNKSYVSVRKELNSEENLRELSQIIEMFLYEHIINSKLKTYSIIKDMNL